MTAPSPTTTPQIAEKRVADLTVAEFETLMRGIMQETLREVQAMIWELEQQLPDPDESLTLSAETEARLREFAENPRQNLVSAADVAQQLGLTL